MQGVHAPLREVSTISARSESINVLHVLRAPVGGLFRHVLDLARGQAARGHRVGIIADATTGGSRAEAALADLSPRLALGVSRVPMSRQIGLRDVAAVAHVARRAAEVGARRAARPRRQGRRLCAARARTARGAGLYAPWRQPAFRLGLAHRPPLSDARARSDCARTDLFLFESAYGRDVFRAKVGDPGARARVVHNGVTPAEFAPITTDPQASDLVFVGELRVLKGVDVLIEAIALLAREGRSLSATIVGEGPDRAAFEAQVRAQDLGERVRFVGAKPARQAFACGRLLVIPSRAESLPYIVLEAAAAGVPLVTTKVGGIPEIFGPDALRARSARRPCRARARDRSGVARFRPPSAPRRERLQARVRAAFPATR